MTPIRYKALILPFIIPILSIWLLSGCIPDDELLNPADPREAIEGVWQCDENSASFQHQVYEVTISKSFADSTQVLINNFFGLGLWVEAKANLQGSQLVIPNQTIENYSVSGTGTINSDKSQISLQYFVSEVVTKKNSAKNLFSETVSAVYVKK